MAPNPDEAVGEDGLRKVKGAAASFRLAGGLSLYRPLR
jgi:hypothetical protein